MDAVMWKNNVGPEFPKIAYLFKIKKYGKEYYAGVGYTPNQMPLDACSGLYSTECAEANVASIVGQVSAEIQRALDESELATLLGNVTDTAGRDLMVQEQYNASDFETWVLTGMGSDMVVSACAGQAGFIGLPLETVVSLGEYLGIVSTPGSSVVELIEASSSTGMSWFTFDWVSSDFVSKQRTFLASPTLYNGETTYYVVSSFINTPEPATCAGGCPTDSACSSDGYYCACDFGMKANYSAQPAAVDSPTCGVGFDYTMQCEIDLSLYCDDGELKQYNFEGELQCQLCPGGSYYSNTGTCTECDAGYAVAGAEARDSCTACMPGYYAPHGGMSMCIACDYGSYTDKHGSTACITCPEGTECPGGADLVVNEGYWRSTED